MIDVDWVALRATAEDVAARAYAPYSRLRVGAAGLVDDDRIVTGCNVENASFGLSLCAECGVVSDLHRTGGGRRVAVICVAGPVDGPLEIAMPCGRCRQLLQEAGGAALLVGTPSGAVSIGALLPEPFGSDRLP